MKPKELSWWYKEPFIWIFVPISLFTVGALYYLYEIILSRSECSLSGDVIQRHLAWMKLNEVGDLLAGAFAPIAFLWLMAAVLLQSFELRAQRRELRETSDIADKQRKTTEAQVELIRKQTEILAEQLDSQRRDIADSSYSDLLDNLETLLRNRINKKLVMFRGEARSHILSIDPPQLPNERDDFLIMVSDSMEGSLPTAIKLIEDHDYKLPNQQLLILTELHDLLVELRGVVKEASVGFVILHETLKLERLCRDAGAVLETHNSKQ